MAGFFERLKAGLSRTADAFANLLARPMDAAARFACTAASPT